MTLAARDAVRKVALRVIKDPTAGTLDDLKKLAAGFLMLADGRLPAREP